MPPAVAAAGIVAAGTIGGAILGGSAQKKAASQANAAQQQATNAQLQLGQQSLALNKDIYNSNYSLLSPFVSRGNVAGDSINALLGLPQAPVMASPLAGSSSGTGTATGAPSGYTGPTLAEIMAMQNDGIPGNFQPAMNAYLAAQQQGQVQTNPTGSAPAPVPVPGATPTPTTPTTTPQTASSALNNFANSAGMQFQLQQGSNALNNLYAGRGSLQSGAAMKGISNYAQNTALQNYFLPYMGLLGGQQGVGAQAGSAVAGVGSAFGNTAANINAGMGANIQNGANAASNAALLKGQANANMYSGIGSGLGSFASSFFPTGIH